MTNRDKLIAKIRALMAKTIGNGCTEAEAMSALNMAQAMMDAYEVSEADLQLGDEKAQVGENNARDPHNIRRGLVVQIARFAGVKTWQIDKGKFRFVGLQSDIEFASWLLDKLGDFVTHELNWFLVRPEITKETRRLHINGFVLGCTSRINQRIKELLAASEVKASNNANALIVIKNELIDKKLNELGLHFKTPRNRGSRVDIDSYKHGKAAGDKATFGRPVGSGQQTFRITKQ